MLEQAQLHLALQLLVPTRLLTRLLLPADALLLAGATAAVPVELALEAKQGGGRLAAAHPDNPALRPETQPVEAQVEGSGAYTGSNLLQVGKL